MPGWTASRLVGRMALRTAAGASLAYILLPMFFVIWLAFFAQEIPSFPPEGYSLKWFGAIAGNDRFITGFLLSLQVAVVATSIGLAIGVPAGHCRGSLVWLHRLVREPGNESVSRRSRPHDPADRDPAIPRMEDRPDHRGGVGPADPVYRRGHAVDRPLRQHQSRGLIMAR